MLAVLLKSMCLFGRDKTKHSSRLQSSLLLEARLHLAKAGVCESAQVKNTAAKYCIHIESAKTIEGQMR